MNKQKGLAPILIVLLIAVGIGGYLIYQKQFKSVSTPQPTAQSSSVPISSPSNNESTNSAGTANPNAIGANWKTYTKNEWKIEFKYPEGAKILENTETSLLIAGYRRSNGINIVSDRDKRYVVPSKLKSCKEVDAEIEKNPSVDRPICLDSGNKFGQSKDIDIVDLNGTSMRSFYETYSGMGGTYHVLQTIQQPFIQLSSFYPDETLFNQILSTFKFLP